MTTRGAPPPGDAVAGRERSTIPARIDPPRTGPPGFDEFYLANFDRLIMQVYAYTGDLQQAQDFVQEAFARALPRWEKLVDYEDPVAWVRRVAWNLASSRWRQIARFDAFARRHRDQHASEPSPDRVELTRALRRLPADHRRVIVLHYLADLPVVEIAQQENVAVSASPSEPTPSSTVVTPTTPPSTASSMGSSPTVAPDGRFSKAQLTRATLDLPAWSPGTFEGKCPSGKVTLTGEITSVGANLNLSVYKVIHVDVDRDGAQETVAQIVCGYEASYSQVIAFDRDAAGKVVTIGQVIASGPEAAVRDIIDLGANANGQIRVEVADKESGGGLDPRLTERQWRGYTLDGQRFRQTDGQTKFHPIPTAVDLSVTATDVTFGGATGGVRRGTMTITVTNRGSRAATGVWLEVDLANDAPFPAPVQFGAIPSGCRKVQNHGDAAAGMLECHLPGPPAGVTATYSVQFASPVANDPLFTADPAKPGRGSRARAFAAEEQPGIRMLNDPNLDDNRADRTARLGQ